MRTLLTTAIDQQRLVHLLYEGKSCTVEPYVLGRNAKDDDVFLGRQVSPWVPKADSWLVYRLNKIYGLLVLETKFQRLPDLTELPAELLSGIRLMV